MAPYKGNKSSNENGVTISELIEKLGRFDGDLAQFLENSLAAQCILASAQAGAVVRFSGESEFQVLSIYPAVEKMQALPQWLGRSIEIIRENISAKASMIEPIQGDGDSSDRSSRRSIILVPGDVAGIGQVMTVFLIEGRNAGMLESTRQKLELSSRLCSLSGQNRTAQKLQSGLSRIHMATETLSAINAQKRFKGMAMALCNEVAATWKCERVAVGFLKGRYVQLKAMSHTENFSRKMQVVQDIESAMEECLDQDIEVFFPAGDESTFVNRAAQELSKRHGPMNVLSLPLRREGTEFAVLTLERPVDRPFGIEEIEAIRLACELCTPRLIGSYENDRWFGAKIAAKVRSLFSVLLGTEHTWAKLTAVIIFAGVLFLIFAKGQFKAEAPFILEAVYQQVIPAPFDGYIKSVEVEVDDEVEGNKTILASLDTAELRLQLAAVKAEKAGYLKQASAAMSDGETARAQIAEANADKAAAQIDLLGFQISQADLVSPLSGKVVQGDLKRQIGAPVKMGDILFEVAPVESLRAELMVPEDEIFDVKVGQEGYLATFSYPAKRIRFEVERIEPAAEVVNQRNVFKVRVRLLETHSWMRPGMEGVAKVHVGKRRYVWIWTRKIINWIRMKFWF